MSKKLRPLSARATQLLLLVDTETDIDWSTGVVDSFFMPRADPVYVESLNDRVRPYGSDAQCFKGLVARGLIRPVRDRDVPGSVNMSRTHCYVLTEDGLREVERIPQVALEEGTAIVRAKPRYIADEEEGR